MAIDFQTASLRDPWYREYREELKYRESRAYDEGYRRGLAGSPERTVIIPSVESLISKEPLKTTNTKVILCN